MDYTEVDQRQPDLASEVGLDRPRAREAAAAGRLRYEARQVPHVPAVRPRGRRGRYRNSARERTTRRRLLH